VSTLDQDADTYSGAGAVRLRLRGIDGLTAQVRTVIQVTMRGNRYAIEAAQFALDCLRKTRPEMTLMIDYDIED